MAYKYFIFFHFIILIKPSRPYHAVTHILSHIYRVRRYRRSRLRQRNCPHTLERILLLSFPSLQLIWRILFVLRKFAKISVQTLYPRKSLLFLVDAMASMLRHASSHQTWTLPFFPNR